ncbi:protein of unknown function [Lachnospiraceae bacterium]|nr:protein of unknown function [Lachnospiraceae bacterium]
MKRFFGILLIWVCGLLLTGCGDDFYMHTAKYDEKYFNSMITAIESGDADNIKSLFAADLQENSDDLDVGIQEILSLYQGKMVSNNSIGSEIKSLSNGYKHQYSVYEIKTDRGEYCLAYQYQAGGEKDKIGFRHVAMCYQENFLDEDVVIAYPQCEGAYAYCSDEAKKRINKKLEEAGYDFEMQDAF